MPKQSSFRPASTPLVGDETVDLIQGGKNRRTSLNNFLARAFARANHTGAQAISTVTHLQATLDAKALDTDLDALASATTTALAGKAPSTGIAQSAVTNLVSDLAAKATPAEVNAAVAALVDSSPAALDTLNELAAALGDDANFAATMTTALAGKQDTIPSGTYAGIGTANTLTGANAFQGAVTNRNADSSEFTAKPLGDGTSGLRNLVNDDTVGYLDHLHTGPNSGANAGCIGIGTDFGNGNGLLVSVKAGGYGVAVAHNPSATGSGFNVIGYNSANYPARFDIYTNAKPVLFIQQPGAGYGDGVVTAGSPVLQSATAAFVVGDVGATVTQLTTRSSSPSAIPAGTTIISRESATSVTLSANATANATAMNFLVGGRTIGATVPAMTEYHGGSAAQKWVKTRLTSADAQASFQIGINGGMDWGAGGSSATDIDLYRATNGRLRTSKQFLADDGLGTKVVAGTVSDASFLRAPPDGQVALDSTGSKIWVRMAGVWKSVAVA